MYILKLIQPRLIIVLTKLFYTYIIIATNMLTYIIHFSLEVHILVEMHVVDDKPTLSHFP